MRIIGLVLGEGDPERLGADPDGVDPLETAVAAAVVEVVVALQLDLLELLADLLGDLPEQLDVVLTLAEVLGDHEHVAEAEHQPHDRERPVCRVVQHDITPEIVLF